ncbi:hypothetical protein BGX38DRAFT_1330789 [Terfezia claveryi]|nr:hypothetical protein BGX38DRAFT_1330789 [Terfezia claveryi]
MSAATMSISANALHLRDMFFDLSKPVTISPETFDKVWPYVDSVYTKLQPGLLQAQVASHGIYGMILNIMDAARMLAIVQGLQKVISGIRSLLCGNWPANQKLLARELDAVEERIAKGKEVPNFDENLRCHCNFHRQCLLPCRHIFHLDTKAKVLTPLHWEAYIEMFAEGGMEVYETVGTVWVEEEGNVERANIVIRVRESFEQVQL